MISLSTWVDEDRYQRYRRAAVIEEKRLSTWMRDTLDEATESSSSSSSDGEAA